MREIAQKSLNTVAFLTTTVAKSQTARTIAANYIVNSGFMVAATLLLSVLIGIGLTIDDTLLMVAAMCLMSSVQPVLRPTPRQRACHRRDHRRLQPVHAP